MSHFRFLTCTEQATRKCTCIVAFLMLAALALGSDVLALSIESYTVHIRSYSILHSDGSIERSVIQPKEFTSETARKSEAWQQSDSNRGGSSFKAKGRFGSVDLMPAYYEYYGGLLERRTNGKKNLVPSTLWRRYAYIDHVFAREHQWREQLQHGPRLDEMMAAFHKAMEWNFTLQKGALLARLRPEYDATPYLEWYWSELVPIAEALLLLHIERAVRGREEQEKPDPISIKKLQEFREQAMKGITKESRENENGESEDWVQLFTFLFALGVNTKKPDEMLTALRRFAPGRIIRRTDGKPVDLATAESLWKENADAALEEFISDNYSGEERLGWKMMETMQSVLGPYVCILCDGYDFLFTLSMPGYIVESNGDAKSENEIAWRFDEHQVYPFGYGMHARSLEPDLETQQVLTGGQPIVTRQELLEFIDILSRDPLLQEKLEKSREAGRLLADAAFKLGQHYRANRSPRMWFWYCHAASQGHESTLHYLASWYASDPVMSRIGLKMPAGITPDDRAAYIWYAIAESNGYAWAADDRKLLAARLSPQAREQAEQMLKAWTPEQCPWPESGDRDAQVRLP